VAAAQIEHVGTSCTDHHLMLAAVELAVRQPASSRRCGKPVDVQCVSCGLNDTKIFLSSELVKIHRHVDRARAFVCGFA
jgi:hypothetical protein